MDELKTDLASSLSSLFEIQNLEIEIEQVSLSGDPIEKNYSGAF